MKIIINERFEIEREPMQWVLIEHRFSDRDGKPIENTYRSFYYQFSILCADIIEKCPAQASDLREVIANIKEAKTALTEAVKVSRLHELVKSVAKAAKEEKRNVAHIRRSKGD